MRKQESMLEWQMLEENAAWPPPTLASYGTPAPRRLPRRWRWSVLAVLLAGLLPALVEGYREVRRANQTMDRVENEVRSVVAADAWIDHHQGQRVKTAGLVHPNPQITQEPGLEARWVDMRGDYAMAEVWTRKTALPWMTVPYRQTRFYHASEQGWLPVAPPDAFYQPLATLQVGRFTFVYGPRDAAAVQEVARQVEDMDTALRSELGLPSTDEALTVNVVTNILPSLDPVELMRMSDGAALYAPSPALLRLPAHISEGEALLQLVAGLLIQRDLDEALVGSAACNWPIPVDGLHLWLLREYSDLPSLSRYNAENILKYRRERDILPSLAWYGPDRFACSPKPTMRGSASTGTNDGTVAVLVDYAVSTYGRERLPLLIEGMKRYDAWEELIPVVYGVSAAEFEAGWQEYLLRNE